MKSQPGSNSNFVLIFASVFESLSWSLADYHKALIKILAREKDERRVILSQG